MTWFIRPRISARLRPTGMTWARSPSCTASPTREGKRRLELGGRGGERLDLVARALERRIDRRRLDAAGSGLIDAGLCPLDRVGIHRGRRYSRYRTARLRRRQSPGVRHEHFVTKSWKS